MDFESPAQFWKRCNYIAGGISVNLSYCEMSDQYLYRRPMLLLEIEG